MREEDELLFCERLEEFAVELDDVLLTLVDADELEERLVSVVALSAWFEPPQAVMSISDNRLNNTQQLRQQVRQ